MAYATDEERHAKQAAHEGTFSLENKLRQYLQLNYAPENISDVVRQQLLTVARNYDADIGVKRSDAEYKTAIDEAIDRFRKNYERGYSNSKAAFGKGHDAEETWNNIRDRMQDLRW